MAVMFTFGRHILFASMPFLARLQLLFILIREHSDNGYRVVVLCGYLFFIIYLIFATNTCKTEYKQRTAEQPSRNNCAYSSPMEHSSTQTQN